MYKKLSALLLIPILILCGCNYNSFERLTAEEYDTAIKAAWVEFVGGTADWAKEYASIGEGFDNYKAAGTQLQAACDRTLKGLDMFSQINPPEEFEETHKKLLKAAESEKRWVSYREQSFKADSKEESDKILDKLTDEINSMPTEDLLPDIYLKLCRELGEFGNPHSEDLPKIYV